MSKLKVNTITEESNSTLTLGQAGTNVVLAAGATQTGFGGDLTPLQNDMSVLALHQAINSNQTAHGLQNSWIEQFEDSNSITDLTTCSRDSSDEYVSTIYASVTTTTPSSVSDWAGSTAHATYGSGTLNITTADKTLRSSAVLTGDFTLLATPTNISSSPSWIGIFRSADLGQFIPSHENGYLTGITEGYVYGSHSRDYKTAGFTKSPHTSLQAYSSSNNDVVKIQRVGSTLYNYLNGTLKHTQSSVSTGTMYVLIGGHANSNHINISWDEATDVVSATGSFTSTTITPQDSASKSSLGLVLLYKDNAGTNALNTDIVAQVSADNGVNYTDCVLASRGTFSTGIKTAIAPAVDVISGNQLKYKISFANQASGSKEAQVYGVSLQY